MAEEMADSSPPPSAHKERHSLTLDQRRALRRWANSQTVRPSHKSCIEWFAAQYDQTISQSTVSHSLSPKYARLDGDPGLSGSRLRYGNWPDVEKLVLLWHQQVVNSGRHPSNDELADKAKAIFSQLPKYKDQEPPEFSPGWIHRFKKRYNLLIRRQRRNGSAVNPADDIPYLVDAVPRFMTVSPDTSPAAIRDNVQRVIGVEATLATCARVRDDIIRRLEESPQHNGSSPPHHNLANAQTLSPQPPGSAQQQQPNGEPMQVYADDDPEVVLQNALRALQQEEADAEAEAAAVREERDRGLHQSLGQSYAQQAAAGALASTPVHGSNTANNNPNNTSTPSRFGPGSSGGPATGPRYDAHNNGDLTLTPIPVNGPTSLTDRPLRCPFCVNARMLRTIKEAVEHLSTHVVV